MKSIGQVWQNIMQPEPVPSDREMLAGLVERVTFHNAENGFCVMRIKARGHERATGTRTYGTDQCAPSSALKLVIPESNDPVIAVVASAPRGKSIFVIEARKIAAIGRAMTK
jgi:hypothetical protein